ncbi:MAG: sulfatase-like hydrolase/transferase [Firmicutes bacterium]|nr:sulfatase-like hydrolase/transferase [Bacillota bacterium]
MPSKILPNILLILADQHRYDCIGYSNIYPIHTPNIDRLAEQGMWFTNAYTPIPVCCPARQSMLNGRRPETFGALWNYNNGLKVSTLSPNDYTWVKDIKEHVYRTGHVGKWSISPEYGPDYYGFDDYVSDAEYRDFRKDKYPCIKFTNGFFGEIDAALLEHSHTHWLADKTIQMMERYAADSRPWLISLDFSEPHLPCRPSEPFACMYNPSAIPMWPSFEENFENKPYIQKQQLYSWNIENFTWDDWAPIVARYYGIISQMDDAIGKIINKLDLLGLAEDTVVIYTSDHGDMCGSHRMIDKHYVLYDDIVKVPLIVRWPSTVESGTVCSDFICHSLDIPPTILDVANINKKDFFQGKSLLPLLRGEMVNDWRNYAVSTYNGQQFGLYTQRMIRTKEWKYIWNTTDVDELYNLKDDPYELHNVIYDSQYKELVSELRYMLYKELIKDEDGLVIGNEWLKTQLIGGKKI